MSSKPEPDDEVTPSWTSCLPIYLAAMEHGSDTARDIAKAELRRMAIQADKFRDLKKQEKAA